MDREKRKGLFIQRRQAAERRGKEGVNGCSFPPPIPRWRKAIHTPPFCSRPNSKHRAFAEGCQKQPLEFVVWLEALKFCANANCVAGALTSSLPSSDLSFGLGCEQHFCPHPTDNTKCLSEKETVLG